MSKDTLIKTGFTKRQAEAITTDIGAGGGGGSSSSLVLADDIPSDTPLPLQGWNPGLNADGKYQTSDNTWIPFQLTSLAGGAISYDQEAYEVTYNEAGLYLTSLQVQLITSLVPAPDPVDRIALMALGDSWWLFASVLGRNYVGTVLLTWTGPQSAGDTNTTPYISGYVAPQQVAVKNASYNVTKIG
jgi:hypothetical protein